MKPELIVLIASAIFSTASNLTKLLRHAIAMRLVGAGLTKGMTLMSGLL
jgi:hypothetical protein